MKIAFVCESLSFGGIERVISIISESFAKNGVDVTILTTVDNKRSYELDFRIKTRQIEYTQMANSAVKVYQKIRGLRKNILTEKYDVCIAFGYKASVYSIIAATGIKTKIIISARNDPDSYGNGLIRKVRDLAYRRSDLLVCQTEYVKQYYEKRLVRNSIIIPNPIKADLPVPFKGNRDKRVVNFCRLNRQKNIPLLIDAFSLFHKHHPAFSLCIYGQGDIKEELVEHIAKKGLQKSVKIQDFTSNIHEAVINASMFVSSSDYEGISNSMLEALAIGLPTICTDCPVGGASLAIADGINGILVPVNNVQELAKAMQRVAENDEFSKSLSENGALIRERFSTEKILKQWEAAIIRVLEKQ